MLEIKWAQVVQTHDVVRMRVGIEDRIDAMQMRAQGLRTEVRWRIDEHATAIETERDGRTQPLIARIGRGARPDTRSRPAESRNWCRNQER